jgi:hypothetical protein
MTEEPNKEEQPPPWPSKAVLAVWDKGLEIKTQYDKPEDPPSKDATVVVTIAEPFSEPRIHKNFPQREVKAMKKAGWVLGLIFLFTLMVSATASAMRWMCPYMSATASALS